MAYEEELDSLNQSLQTAINYQNSQQSLKLAENDLEFGKESFAQQMALANQQFDWNQRVANRNYEWQKTQWEYQKELNNLAMQREDTAFQRARADLEKAGLSPLMLSSGANATPLSSGTAPQYDVNGVNTAYGAKQDALERRRQQINENRQYRYQLKQANRQFGLQTASLALQVEKQGLDNWEQIERIRSERAERNYNEKYGWRNQNVTSAIIGLADYFLRNKNPVQAAKDKAQSIADSLTAEKNSLVNQFNEKKERLDENLASDIKLILNEVETPVNPPNDVPDRCWVSPVTYSRIDKLSRDWSKDLAIKTYEKSSVLQLCYNREAWINYYSKNVGSLLKRLNK